MTYFLPGWIQIRISLLRIVSDNRKIAVTDTNNEEKVDNNRDKRQGGRRKLGYDNGKDEEDGGGRIHMSVSHQGVRGGERG